MRNVDCFSEDHILRYTNAHIYQSGYGFRRGSFTVEDGRFTDVMFDGSGEDPGHTGCGSDGSENEYEINLGGRYVIPGLVDIHIHGCAGADCSDADPDGLHRMGTYLAAHGVTSYLPTLATLPEDETIRACRTIAGMNPGSECARIWGLRMEGPYLSPKKKGSQNETTLCKPNIEQFKHIYDISRSAVRIVDVAPEIDDAGGFIREASGLCCVSVGHTTADYETSIQAFRAGASHITHMFNAMTGIHHRDPGVIGAAYEAEAVTAEIICDGIHVHPSAVKLAFKLFSGRICLISDALRCCGMPDGEYDFGGQTVHKYDGAAWLAEGVLAGSAADLWQCLRNAVSYGIDMSDAIDAVTITPATVMGADEHIGSITAGKYADFIVCTPDLGEYEVYYDGGRIPWNENYCLKGGN